MADRYTNNPSFQGRQDIALDVLYFQNAINQTANVFRQGL